MRLDKWPSNYNQSEGKQSLEHLCIQFFSSSVFLIYSFIKAEITAACDSPFFSQAFLKRSQRSFLSLKDFEINPTFFEYFLLLLFVVFPWLALTIHFGYFKLFG